MKVWKFGFGAAVLGCLLAMPRPAAATSIVVSGDTVFTVTWLYTATNPDLAGSARFTISNWTGSSFDLAIDQIRNTTALTPNINARLTSFGFGLDPDATSFGAYTNGSDFSWGFSNFPAFQTVDICASSGNGCAGGSSGGLNQGESSTDVMRLTINGSFASGVTFAPIPVKFQTDPASYEFDASTITVCTTCNEELPPDEAPEPGTLVLLGTGFVAVAVGLRRRFARTN